MFPDLSEVSWHKSNYQGPHEYILVHENPTVFEDIFQLIKCHGEQGRFKGKRFRYYYHDGYRYWRIGIVLNRAKINLDVEKRRG